MKCLKIGAFVALFCVSGPALCAEAVEDTIRLAWNFIQIGPVEMGVRMPKLIHFLHEHYNVSLQPSKMTSTRALRGRGMRWDHGRRV